MQERLEETQEDPQDLTPAVESVGETVPEIEPDPETRLAELEAQIASKNEEISKLENDVRSKDGQRRKESDRDEDLRSFGDELGAMRKMIANMAAGMSTGNLEAVATQISQMDQERDQTQAVRAAEARYNAEEQRLLATVQDGEEVLVSDEDRKALIARWTKAWEIADSGGGYDEVMNTHIEANSMVLKEARRRAEDERKQLRDEVKNARKKAFEDAGVADLDTGAAIAGGREELSGTALIERGLRTRLNNRL